MDRLIKILRANGVAVVRTDTLYGILGTALDELVVERIYKIKKRNRLKPVIVLISHPHDIEKYFFKKIDPELKEILFDYWPGKVSIVLETDNDLSWHYLHKGTGGIAFRVPDNEDLRFLLKETGPLVAPSANPEGEAPAKNIREAMRYFGDLVDYYHDGGDCLNEEASKIIRIKDDLSIEFIRGKKL